MSNTPQTEASRLADELRAELLVDIGSPYKTTNVSKRLVDESAAELRRLDAENKQQRAALERKSEAIQKLWAERDQLRTQVERLQSQPAAWECFLDPSYFDMWAVKRKDSRSFQDAFHVTSEVEAQRLCGLLNGIRQPAAPALVTLLAESDLKWLKRFKETTEDDQSYDVPNDAIKRLAELGAVRWVGVSRYAITAFGAFVADPDDRFSGSLPLKTYADHIAASNAEHQARMNGIGQPAGGEGKV